MLEAVQMYVPGIILLAWESFDQAEREEERLHLLEKEKIATELNYLKAKVNPQFIFNTLNNLKTFVDEQSEKAPDMILRLSEVLDYVLYRSQQDVLKLKDEIDVIAGFIALEKLRLGERLNIVLNATGDVSVDIAPLTLLSVVESSLKENILNQSGRLDVAIQIEATNEEVKCVINVQKERPSARNHNGLDEIRRQLALTYPERHNLSQSEEETSIITLLSLKVI